MTQHFYLNCCQYCSWALETIYFICSTGKNEIADLFEKWYIFGSKCQIKLKFKWFQLTCSHLMKWFQLATNYWRSCNRYLSPINRSTKHAAMSIWVHICPWFVREHLQCYTTLEYNYKLCEYNYLLYILLILHILKSNIHIFNSMLLYVQCTSYTLIDPFRLQYRNNPNEGFIHFILFKQFSVFVRVRFHRVNISKCLTFVNMNLSTTTVSKRTECFE